MRKTRRWRRVLLYTLTLLTATASFALAQERANNLPEITLHKGEFFFRVNGRPSFLLGHNLSVASEEELRVLLAQIAQSGERIVRIQITSSRRPRGTREVDEAWALWWDHVFDLAAQNGLYVLPVFSQWGDWNDGGNDGTPLVWHYWEQNPFNAALGGPADSPVELLRNTQTRQLWLEWLRKLVTRWQGRPNILGWEIFSEIDLVSGASEADGVDFVENAARAIRAADTHLRPVTASLSGINDWPSLSRSDALDFIEIHPYANLEPFNGNLDDLILQTVRQRLKQYGKPIFLGESGLDARPPVNTLSVGAEAPAGIKNAIWAAAVSGVMNGRMLWWEDGYDAYYHLDLRAKYQDLCLPVVSFLQNVDYTGFRPIDIALDHSTQGAALGNSRTILVWVRDARSSAPKWPIRSLRGLTVTVSAPGPARNWKVDFYDTESGRMFKSTSAHRRAGGIAVLVPSFRGSIAFKLRALGI